MKKKIVIAAMMPFALAMGAVWAQGTDQTRKEFTYPPLRDMTGRIVSDRFGHERRGADLHHQHNGARRGDVHE